MKQPPRRSALQDWVMGLTVMQQSVLIASVRGPDGIKKDHVAKVLCRWLRRSFLISAFDRVAILDPYSDGGGSFTGPCNFECADHGEPDGMGLSECGCYSLDGALDEYFRRVDELPHHFQLHLMHAAEILGYKHPNIEIRAWWNQCYRRMVNDMHLQPESEETMDIRLGDNEHAWRSAEEVTAQ